MRIYISGPMTGFPDHNKAAFAEAATHLRSLGHDVVSPAELQHNQPDLDGDGWNVDDEHYEEFMEEDFTQVDSCDAIAFLKGWSFSGGAGREGRRAIEQGLRLYLLWKDPTEDRWFPLLRIGPKFFLENSTTERLTPSGAVD